MKNEISIVDCISQMFERASYFSINALRDCADAQGLKCKPDTVKSYLSRQKKAGKIFDAGRGWYSSLSEPYQLDVAPVEKLVGELKEAFPLLEFACWSTAQLNDMLRHQLAKHVQFVYVERDAMQSVADWLRGNGYRPCVNPGKKERRSFAVEENSVVVFPITSEAPSQDGFATIEKVLVDVLSDLPCFSIINIPEFIGGASRSICLQRVDVAILKRYSSRRKTNVSDLENGAEIH